MKQKIDFLKFTAKEKIIYKIGYNDGRIKELQETIKIRNKVKK